VVDEVQLGDIPDKVLAVTTKCRLFEVSGHEFVVFDFDDLLLPQSTSTMKLLTS